MQHIQENIQFKAIRLGNITTSGQKKIKILCMNVVASIYKVLLKNIIMYYQNTKVQYDFSIFMILLSC